MGLCLHRVEKIYGEEIIRNDTMFDVINYLESLSNYDLGIKIDWLDEAGYLELQAIPFKKWYETNKDLEIPVGMKDLYKEVVKFIEEKNIVDECEYITFEWY